MFDENGNLAFIGKDKSALKKNNPSFIKMNQARKVYEDAFTKFINKQKKENKSISYIDAGNAANAAIKIVYKIFPSMAGAQFDASGKPITKKKNP